MAKPYFREIPNFEYVNRSPDRIGIGDYVTLKNLFKRAKINTDILENITAFEKYSIEGDERPDNIANKFYKDPTLDWVVLLTNNILNVRYEWPIRQSDLENFLIEKYGSYQKLYDVHHYETLEVTDSSGFVLVPGGLIVTDKIIDTRKKIIKDNQLINNPTYGQPVPYFVQVYNPDLKKEILYTDILKPVSNYEYEFSLEEKKRQIYILKAEYLNILFNDLSDAMQYKRGSGQYVTRSLKRGDNINLG